MSHNGMTSIKFYVIHVTSTFVTCLEVFLGCAKWSLFPVQIWYLKKNYCHPNYNQLGMKQYLSGIQAKCEGLTTRN